MLMSYLTPEERKKYKRGDYVNYDKDSSRYETADYQKRLKERYEREQLLSYIPYMPVRKMHCAFCGDMFYTDNVRRKYCSGRCVNDAYMERRDKHKQAERKKVCPVCGKSFEGKTKATIYCSKACKQKKYREDIRKKYAELEKVTLPKSDRQKSAEQELVTLFKSVRANLP